MEHEQIQQDFMADQKLCNLYHPIFDLMGTTTRREIVRLISCEHNYGNQLAKILDVSNPTVHRHLKKLVDDGILEEQGRTSESYSGHKGGEAVKYEITQSTNLFLSISPHLVHAHILEIDKNGDLVKNEPLNKINYQFKDNNDSKNMTNYVNLAHQSQQLNNEILELEQQLMDKLQKKNKVMQEIDNHLNAAKLNFRERIILRALACLGPGCYDDIAKILNADQIMIEHMLKNLEDKQWIEEIKA